MHDPARRAYADALAMLARRELTEARVRERLARREHPPEAIDAALERLRAVRAVDDRRVARSAARTEAEIKGRGPARVIRQLQAIGVPAEIAEEAVTEVFGAVDQSALLDRAIARRLRGPSAAIRDAAHFRRLHQQLVRLGFSSGAVVSALKSRARRDAHPDDE